MKNRGFGQEKRPDPVVAAKNNCPIPLTKSPLTS